MAYLYTVVLGLALGLVFGLGLSNHLGHCLRWGFFMGPFCAIVQLNEYFAVSVRGFGLGVRSMPVGCLMG